MLPGTNAGLSYQDHTSSTTNPDGLAREGSGSPPDPIGRLYMKVLLALEDRLSSLRHPNPNLRPHRQPSSHTA
jgi:hypothetical protein